MYIVIPATHFNSFLAFSYFIVVVDVVAAITTCSLSIHHIAALPTHTPPPHPIRSQSKFAASPCSINQQLSTFFSPLLFCLDVDELSAISGIVELKAYFLMFFNECDSAWIIIYQKLYLMYLFMMSERNGGEVNVARPTPSHQNNCFWLCRNWISKIILKFPLRSLLSSSDIH